MEQTFRALSSKCTEQSTCSSIDLNKHMDAIVETSFNLVPPNRLSMDDRYLTIFNLAPKIHAALVDIARSPTPRLLHGKSSKVWNARHTSLS